MNGSIGSQCRGVPPCPACDSAGCTFARHFGVSPTPAAPAGSGVEWDEAAKAVARLAEGPDAGWGIWRDWLRSHLTGPGPGNLNLACPGFDRLRVRAEAAERERDEARAALAAAASSAAALLDQVCGLTRETS